MGVDGLLAALGLLEGAKRQPRGRLVLCPHHRERDPSCSVQEREGRILAKCHACDWSGDALALVAEVRGLDVRSRFALVLDEGAALAGVYPSTSSSTSPRREPPKPRAAPEPEPPALADEVFHELVAYLVALSPVTAEPDVRNYLAGRGLLDEAVASGWGALPQADDQWRVLAEPIRQVGAMLLAKDVTCDETRPDLEWRAGLEAFRLSGLALVRAGALVLDARGHPRCSWPSHRLVIPHRSPDGTIYACKRRLVGELVEGAAPKYVAATGRPIRWPYGVEAMRDAAPDVPVMFVEGEADTLDRRAKLRQNGADRVVLGLPGVSSWRPEWAAYARGRTAYVALDTDEAGKRKEPDVVDDLYAAGAELVKVAKPRSGKDWNQRSEVRP